MDIKDKIIPDMVFEMSSGYLGYRCAKCGKWEYAGVAQYHNCDKPNLKLYDPTTNEYKNEAYQLMKSFSPRIYSCVHCGYPVATGYCCYNCGSKNSSSKD